MTTVALATLDVFTTRRFAGNPLGVVCTDALLDAVLMQRIAAEVDYSETTFVLRADVEATRASPRTPLPVRIFTPTTELPFAGHPTVGTACWLCESEGLAAPLTLRLGAGDVVVHREEDPAGGRARYGFDTPAPALLDPLPAAEAAAIAGVPVEAVEEQPCSLVLSGPLYLLVPLADGTALDRLAPDLEALRRLGARLDRLPALFAFAMSGTGDEASVRARMFFDAGSLREDPATGSAVAALGAWVRATGVASLPAELHVRQGEAMGRPSDLYLRVDETALRLSGSAVPLLREGVLDIG
jgi:trans-2,3-dihydro-3-hydroxyanthranilate isomerase